MQEFGDHAAVQIGPGRLAVETEECLGWVLTCLLVDVGHAKTSVLDIMWLVGEIGEVLEPFVRCS